MDETNLLDSPLTAQEDRQRSKSYFEQDMIQQNNEFDVKLGKMRRNPTLTSSQQFQLKSMNNSMNQPLMRSNTQSDIKSLRRKSTINFVPTSKDVREL